MEKANIASKNRAVRVLISLALLAFSTLNILAQSKPNVFKLRVSVTELKAPAKLILTIRNADGWKEYTAESSNGNFLIDGEIKEPAFAFLVMKYKTEADKPPLLTNVNQLFIEKGETVLNASGSLNSSVIKGGECQKELEALRASVARFEADQLTERSQAVQDFVHSHPDSFVSLYALQDLSQDNSFTLDAELALPLFNGLSTKIRESVTGKELIKEIALAKQTAIGSIAPNFTQQDTLARNVSLNDFKGKYVLIDFWASWCKPCRVENPNLVKAYQAFKDRNFTILSVSLDNNKNNWLNAIHKDKLTWTHISDLKFWKNEVAILYGVKTVPQNFMIDPSGMIIAKNITTSKLIEWLNERLP